MFEPVNRKCDGAVSFQGNRATPLILNTFNRSVRKLDWEPVSSSFLFAFFRESVGTMEGKLFPEDYSFYGRVSKVVCGWC